MAVPVDIATLQTIAPGEPFLSATLEGIRDWLEFLADPPACSVYASTASTVPHLMPVALSANNEFYDNDAIHSTTTNTTRLTIQTPGRYLVFATVQFSADADGVRNAKFRVNGSTEHETMQVFGGTSASSCVITSIRSLVLNQGDYVECIASHTAGNDLSVTLREFGVTWFTR